MFISNCRGLFIIDGDGKLRQITINDLPVGRSVDETLRLVQAFQFTDQHGEGEYKILLFNTFKILQKVVLNRYVINISKSVTESLVIQHFIEFQQYF